MEVDDHAPHHVVGGRGHRNALGRRLHAGVAQRGDHVREAGGVDRAHVELDGRRSGSLHQLGDRARHLIARRKLLDEAFAVRAVERRPLAADRLGDQKPLDAFDAGDGGRVELQELEVGELRTGLRGEQHALALGAWRVGGATPQCGGATVRQDRATRLNGGAVFEDDAHRLAVVHPHGGGALAFEHGDPRVLDGERGEIAHDPPAGCAAACMDHAAPRMSAFQPERQPAGTVGVEVHAELLECVHMGGRLAYQDLCSGSAHEAAAGAFGVFEMEFG